jgi:hypothetical protein
MKDSVPPILKNMHKDVILLVEYLDGPGGNNNNVWCSYAHAARYYMQCTLVYIRH